MEEINRLRDIADDIGSTSWGYELASALHDIAAGIGEEVGHMRDLSGYESDVLAWVEKNGGLEAVKERTMPEGMEWLLEVWPKWSNGEYCKFGDWWVSDKYGEPEPRQFRNLSIYTPEQLDEWGQGDGESYGYEWDFLRPSDPKYRPDKVEPPAPKVLDADGVEIHKGDTVWSLGGGGPYTVAGLDGGSPYVLCDDGSGNVPALEPSALTHRAPVLASDGEPLEVGQTVYHIADGKEYTVEELFEDGAMVTPDGITGGRCRADYLTHERPDSFSLIEQDAELTPYDYAMKYGKPNGVSNGKFQRVDLVRRCKALAEKED